MKEKYRIEVRWIAFPLHPETPEEGRTLEDLFAGRGLDLGEVMARLRQVADQEGLPLGERKNTYNSRLAQELGKWAETQGRGEAFHHAVFRAYFADGTNIGKAGPLAALARSVGLSPEGAGRILRERTFREAVDADWARCRRAGIRAVPTFLMDRSTLVGAQPYPAMEAFVKGQGAALRESRRA